MNSLAARFPLAGWLRAARSTAIYGHREINSEAVKALVARIE